MFTGIVVLQLVCVLSFFLFASVVLITREEDDAGCTGSEL